METINGNKDTKNPESIDNQQSSDDSIDESQFKSITNKQKNRAVLLKPAVKDGSKDELAHTPSNSHHHRKPINSN